MAPEQYARASRLAHKIHNQNLASGAKGTNDCPTDQIEYRVEGYAAEYIISLFLDVPFSDDDDYGLDVAGVEVRRATRIGGRLWIVNGKNPHAPHALVWKLRELTYDFRGWAWGYEILEHGFEIRSRVNPARRPAVYLPHELLRPFDTLPAAVAALSAGRHG